MLKKPGSGDAELRAGWLSIRGISGGALLIAAAVVAIVAAATFTGCR